MDTSRSHLEDRKHIGIQNGRILFHEDEVEDMVLTPQLESNFISLGIWK